MKYGRHGGQIELLLVSERERAIRTAICFIFPHRVAAEAAAKRDLPGPNKHLIMMKSLNLEAQPWPTAGTRPVARAGRGAEKPQNYEP